MASIAADYKFSVYYNKIPDNPAEVDKIWSDVSLRIVI